MVSKLLLAFTLDTQKYLNKHECVWLEHLVVNFHDTNTCPCQQRRMQNLGTYANAHPSDLKKLSDQGRDRKQNIKREMQPKLPKMDENAHESCLN